jgi:hypothetical protein
MAITLASGAHAKNPAEVGCRAGSRKREDQAAEPDALDVLEDEEEAVEEAAVDAVFVSDEDFVPVDDEEVDAGELLDDEPRLSLR